MKLSTATCVARGSMRTSIITKPADFKDWMSHCRDTFALDTETTSLDWLDLEIIGFSICDGKQACYVALPSSSAVDIKRKYKKELLMILDYYIGESKMIVMHNSPFDLMVLRKEGIIIDD